MTRMLLALGSIILLGCPVVHAVDKPGALYVASVSCERGPLSLQMGRSLQALRDLGPVLSEEMEKTDVIDAEARVLRFEGLTIHVLFPANDYSKGLIESAEISSPRWTVSRGVKVGMSLEALSKNLKRKLTMANSSAEICGDADCVTLQFARGRVRHIKYVCYTG